MFLGLNMQAWIAIIALVMISGPMLPNKLSSGGFLLADIAILLKSFLFLSVDNDGIELLPITEKGVVILGITGLIHAADIKIVAYWPQGPPCTYLFTNKKINSLVAFLKHQMGITARLFMSLFKGLISRKNGHRRISIHNSSAIQFKASDLWLYRLDQSGIRRKNVIGDLLSPLVTGTINTHRRLFFIALIMALTLTGILSFSIPSFLPHTLYHSQAFILVYIFTFISILAIVACFDAKIKRIIVINPKEEIANGGNRIGDLLCLFLPTTKNSRSTYSNWVESNKSFVSSQNSIYSVSTAGSGFLKENTETYTLSANIFGTLSACRSCQRINSITRCLLTHGRFQIRPSNHIHILQ